MGGVLKQSWVRSGVGSTNESQGLENGDAFGAGSTGHPFKMVRISCLCKEKSNGLELDRRVWRSFKSMEQDPMVWS